MKVRKFLLIFLSSMMLLCIFMASFVYIYDPLLYYRIPEDRVIVNNYRFINPGIIKNADYDTVIIGSSMIQNFNMDSFRDTLNQNPIKVSVGAMSIQGMELSYDYIIDQNKAKTIYVAVDLPALAYAEDDLSTYATYLYDDSKLNDFKYLLGYETWMRLLPLNIGMNVLDKTNNLTSDHYVSKSIDDIGDWSKEFAFDASIVKEQYINKTAQIVDYSTIDLPTRLNDNMLSFIEIFDDFKAKEYVFFFPPYSMLFWYTIRHFNAVNDYLAIKEDIINRLFVNDNVRVFDFQSIPETIDLNYYKDYTHYSPEVNNMMVSYFKSGLYEVKLEEEFSDDLFYERFNSFLEANSEWLND